MKKINWIIIICIVTSVLYWYFDYDGLFEYLVFSGNNLLKGWVWTLVTSLFLHADILHLAGNMIFLFVFGNALEKELDASKTLAAFFFGGAASFLLSPFFYGSATPIIGASAAIFTLTAVVMLVKPLKFSFVFFMPLGLVAIIYFLYNIGAVYFGTEGNVAYISHLIGFVIGIPFGISWSEKWALNLLITIGLSFLYLFIVLYIGPIILGIVGTL